MGNYAILLPGELLAIMLSLLPGELQAIMLSLLPDEQRTITLQFHVIITIIIINCTIFSRAGKLTFATCWHLPP